MWSQKLQLNLSWYVHVRRNDGHRLICCVDSYRLKLRFGFENGDDIIIILIITCKILVRLRATAY